MTGKYPARLHLTDWIKGHQKPYAKLLPPDWVMYLPLEETTIAELLRKRDYSTASIGKWHLGHEKKYYPQNQGFDVNTGGYYKGSPSSYFSPYSNPRLTDGVRGEQLTDRLTEEAVRFIAAQKDGPFFLYLPFYAVHTPLQAKEEDVTYFKERADANARQRNPVYAGLIKNMDRNVGKLMDCLDRLDLTENTLVIFTSDNGGMIGNRTDRHKQITSNYPLREGKGTAYEGGVRIPAIFYWKGRIKPGISATPVISMDVYSTIAAAAGIPPEDVPGNDGVSLLSLLTGGKPLEKRDLFWHYPHYHNQGATPYSAILRENKKLIYFYETGRKELYDLRTDISERYDLSDVQVQETAEMYGKLQQWLNSLGAQFPSANQAVSTMCSKPSPASR